MKRWLRLLVKWLRTLIIAGLLYFSYDVEWQLGVAVSVALFLFYIDHSDEDE